MAACSDGGRSRVRTRPLKLVDVLFDLIGRANNDSVALLARAKGPDVFAGSTVAKVLVGGFPRD